MREQRYSTGTVVLAIIVAAFAGHMVGKSQSRLAPLQACTFERVAGVYQVSSIELQRSTSMVVASRDGRDFAFRRDTIIVCEEATP